MERHAWQRVPPIAVDGALAALFTVLAQVELHLHADDGYKAGPLLLNIPLEALATLPLLLRSTRPRLALLLMGAAIGVPSVFVAHTLLFWGNFLPLMVMAYSVARDDDGLLGRWSWLFCLVAVEAGAIHLTAIRTPGNVFFPLVMFTAPWAAGRLVRTLSRQRAQLAEALQRLAAEQALREEAAVEAERRRIAAEMHDVVAHAVSLMTVQTGAARLQLETAGLPVPEQLRAAEKAGRLALTELRRTLGVMRSPADRGALEPVPGLASLPALVAGYAAAGLEVDLDAPTGSDPADLPASLQLTAYRIVQEALTNVVKHAGPVPVRVVVRRDGTRLFVEVRNAPGRREPGAAVRTSPGGHGLAGMRERVGMFGGTVTAGTDDAGGFVVSASVPVAEEPAALPLEAAR